MAMTIEFVRKDTDEPFDPPFVVEFTTEQWNDIKAFKKVLKIHLWETFFEVLFTQILDDARAAERSEIEAPKRSPWVRFKDFILLREAYGSD